jgi:hypothetical protein
MTGVPHTYHDTIPFNNDYRRCLWSWFAAYHPCGVDSRIMYRGPVTIATP